MNGFDLAYGAGLALAAPFWLIHSPARRKVLQALRQRMGCAMDTSRRQLNRPAVLIHAVSLGEINATRSLIQQLAQYRPDLQYVITTTTVTGYDRARQLYNANPDVTLIRYPLDFSAAINRVLDTLRPDVAVLLELELWPNFLRQCRQRNIAVLLVNGRITPRSFRGYRRLQFLTKSMFGALSGLCAQDQRFAEQFIALGAARDRVRITGTMKFDTAALVPPIDAARQLAEILGLDPANQLIWVCGSTGPGEEAMILELYGQLQKNYPTLRLALIPRHPERFDEVAQLIEQHGYVCLRRSQVDAPQPGAVGSPSTGSITRQPLTTQSVILGDTMGELRTFYSLAALVVVGRSLVDLGQRQHGSDMIEPAALAKPVIVGPYTHNFADAMLKFRAAGAMIEVNNRDELYQQLRRLLDDADLRIQLGQRAADVVRNEQGATAAHVELILKYLPPRA